PHTPTPTAKTSAKIKLNRRAPARAAGSRPAANHPPPAASLRSTPGRLSLRTAARCKPLTSSSPPQRGRQDGRYDRYRRGLDGHGNRPNGGRVLSGRVAPASPRRRGLKAKGVADRHDSLRALSPPQARGRAPGRPRGA